MVTAEPEGISRKETYNVQGRNSLFDDANAEFANDNINGYGDSNSTQDGLYECRGRNADDLSFEGQTPAFVNDTSTSIEASIDVLEVYLAGLIIHIVPEERSTTFHWKSWIVDDRVGGYTAFVANREDRISLFRCTCSLIIFLGDSLAREAASGDYEEAAPATFPDHEVQDLDVC